MHAIENIINICHIISGDLWAGAEVQAYSLIREINRIPRIHLQVITFNKGILASKLAQLGIRTNIIEEKDHNIASIIINIYKLLKKQNIDIIHAHGYKENLAGGIAAKLLHTKLVRTHHGKGMLEVSLVHTVIERVNESLLTNKLISVSSELKEYLVTHKFSKNKIRVILNGVIAGPFQKLDDEQELKNHLRIRDDCTVIVTVGRLVSVKGHKYLLQGAKQIVKKNSKVIFLIVGDGPLLAEMKSLSHFLGIEDHVRFTGFCPDPIPQLKLADIFIMTSLHEGIPMALLEAMSLNKPIIATGVGGIPEIISNGYNGLLIPPGDSGAIADACLKLMTDVEMRSCLAKNAFNDVQNKYSLKITERATLNLYRELMPS
jgi:glycosyltransferase involved in cell wall biosynthesis